MFEILRDQSMHVKTCVQTNSIRVIGHNYMNNGHNFSPSEQLYSCEDNDEDCSADYFILTHIGWDTTWSKYAYKNICTKQ